MARLPFTNSEVWYAYSITLNGVKVGTLRTFNPTNTRTHEYVREIATNGGQIYEGVPGVTDYTIRLEKVRLYNRTLHDEFGILTNDIQNQIRAVDIREEVHLPLDLQNNSVNGPAEQDTGDNGVKIVTYEACWITDWGKTVSNTAITVVETMTVKPTRIVV
jgi:hypothetical protein